MSVNHFGGANTCAILFFIILFLLLFVDTGFGRTVVTNEVE